MGDSTSGHHPDEPHVEDRVVGWLNWRRQTRHSLKSVVDALIWIVIYLLPLGLLFVALALVVRAIWRKVRPAAAPKA